MKFTFARDRTISSTLGHCVFFPKGVATYAPPALHRAVMEAGGEPEDEMEDPRDPTAKTGPAEPTDPEARGADIYAAIEMIVNKNNRDDFTANGSPHTKALSQLVGWKVTPDERDLQWAKFQRGGKDE